MPLKLADGAQKAKTDGVTALIDAGPGDGLLRLYLDAQPADANIEPGNQVTEHAMSATAFGPADNDGIATANPIGDGVTSQAGTIQSFACLDSTGQVVFTGSVSTVGGGGDLQLTSVTVGSGETIKINSLTYTTPQDQA